MRYWHYVRPIFEELTRLHDNGTSEVIGESKHSWWHINELDFDSNDRVVENTLNDAGKNILYEHVSRALKAADDEDPVTIIRELYHVIETNQII